MTSPVPETTRIIVVAPRKSYVAGFLLAFFFGPLGLLYSSVGLGLVMIVLALLVGFVTLGLGLVLVWLACLVLSPVAIAMGNGKAGAVKIG